MYFQVVEQKELAIAEIENKKFQEQEAAEKAAEKLAQKESEICSSPRKDKWQSILEIPDIASMSKKMFGHKMDSSAQSIVWNTYSLIVLYHSECMAVSK